MWASILLRSLMMDSVFRISPRPLGPQHLGDGGELVVDFLHAGGELGRSLDVEHLSGGDQRLLHLRMGLATARMSAAICSRSASDMPRGPNRPPGLSISSAGKPASRTVGTS